MTKDFELMIIEGFYGRPWRLTQRLDLLQTTARAGFQSYLFAPKSEKFLREHWRESFDDSSAQNLRALRVDSLKNRMKLGVGLSPMGLSDEWNPSGRQVLKKKIQELKEFELDFLALLFDDMKGDDPDLAQKQVEICDFCFELEPKWQKMMCPSYYSLDPILDLVFGIRPADYLAELGQKLPQDIQVFWTGNQVCSPAIEVEDLLPINKILQRKVFLWDNEPVNDGVRLAPWLFLRAFPGRSRKLKEHLAGHGSNCMVEPYLSGLIQTTLLDVYQDKTRDADYFRAHLQKYLPSDLAVQIIQDLPILSQGVGPGPDTEQYFKWSRRIFELPNWFALNDFQKNAIRAWQDDFEKRMTKCLSSLDRLALKQIYQKWDHPVAREMVQYLNFEFAFDPNCLT